MNIRKVLGLVLGISLAIPTMLCAGGSKDAGSGKEGKYMRFAWWGNPSRDERTIKVTKMYMEANPGTMIDTENTGWSGYWDKLNTQAATGALPDLMQHDYAYLYQWASRNQLLDLTSYIKDGVIDASKISKSIIASGTVDGKVFGISMGTNAMGICYNRDVVEKSGVKIDQLNWTWDDFEKIATTIYQKTGVQTIPLGTVDIRPIFENSLRQTGVSFYARDGKSLGFTDTSILKDFWTRQLRMIKAGVMVPVDTAFVTVSVDESLFAKEKSWCDFVWSNQLISTQKALGKSIELVLMPKIKDSKRPGTYLKPACFFSIPATAKNPDMAAKVLNYFLNDLKANDVLLGERGVPCPSDVLASVSAKVDPVMKQSYDFVAIAAANSSPIDPPDPGASGEVLKIFRDTAQEVLSGSITVDDGIKKFMDKANAALAGAK